MTLDLQEQTVTVAALLTHLGIEPLEAMLVTVDRRQCTLDEPVPPDGRVCIFSPLSGG